MELYKRGNWGQRGRMTRSKSTVSGWLSWVTPGLLTLACTCNFFQATHLFQNSGKVPGWLIWTARQSLSRTGSHPPPNVHLGDGRVLLNICFLSLYSLLKWKHSLHVSGVPKYKPCVKVLFRRKFVKSEFMKLHFTKKHIMGNQKEYVCLSNYFTKNDNLSNMPWEFYCRYA